MHHVLFTRFHGGWHLQQYVDSTAVPSLVVAGVVVYHDEETLLLVVLQNRGKDPLVLHLRGNLCKYKTRGYARQ